MAGDVGSIMTRKVVTAAPGDTAADVARRLAAHGISALPVCDDGGRVLGIISEGDLLRPFGQRHNLRRGWWPSLLAEGRTSRRSSCITSARTTTRRKT